MPREPWRIARTLRVWCCGILTPKSLEAQTILKDLLFVRIVFKQFLSLVALK